MHDSEKNILLISMPFAETSIPSIQLAVLESYLKQREKNIETRYLYLKTAGFFGLNNYNYLINSPNDSYVAQMSFSKYLFPDHWEKNIEKFRLFYNNVIGYDEIFLNNFSFDKYVEQTDKFYNWVCKENDWEKFDVIGFTLNYGQFLPSLAFSKFIKEKYPEKKIVFGGTTTTNELGRNALKTFDWVDYIVYGDGEEALYLLSTGSPLEEVPGLIWRKKGEIIKNNQENPIDLNSLSYPTFDSYYQELTKTGSEILQYFSLYGRLPIELSRGCWWNNCTFCSRRAYYKKYREKNIERFVEELDDLSKTYKMLTFQIIGNTLPQQNCRHLCDKIIELDKDFTLMVEARAGSLNSEDYAMLKKAGFTHIQTGVEAFSQSYLKKMNKGTTVIDNIAALKFCKENHIANRYNIIINYPNEEPIDFLETEKNIQHIKSYFDPPQISKYILGYGSPIFLHPEKFNIEKIEYKIIDQIMYPLEVLANNICFFNHFKRINETSENKWKDLVQNWKNERYQRDIKNITKRNIVDELVFYYIDGRDFLKIYDKRYGENVMIYVLDDIEREIFLSCIDVTSFEKIKEKNPDISESDLTNILKDFIETGIVYQEEVRYLSLPLSYRLYYNETNSIKKPKKMLASSLN